MFNTLKYVKIMEESGFSREQAESSVGVLVEVMEEKLATKQNMKDLRIEMEDLRSDLRHEMEDLRRDMGDLKNDLRNEMGTLKLEMKHDLALSNAQLKSELTVRLGAMMVTCMTIFTAIFTAIVKLT